MFHPLESNSWSDVTVSVENLRLVLRFLTTRWWAEVEDLVEKSLESGTLAFEDLDLDLDLLELSRVLNNDRRIELIAQVLEPDEELSAALEDYEDAEATHAFFILMAINIALFDGGARGRDLVLKHMLSEEAAFTDSSVFGQMLARTGPLSKARAWVEKSVTDEAQKTEIISAMVPNYHKASGLVLHLDCDRQGSERALVNQCEYLNYHAEEWDAPLAGPRALSLRRIGRFMTFLLECDDEFAQALALSVAHKNALGWAILVDYRDPETAKIQEFKNHRLFRENRDFTSESRPVLSHEEMMGELLEMGIRIYDRQYGRAVSALTFKEVLHGSSKDMGLVRPFLFCKGEGQPKKRHGRTRKGRKK
jgi:hypothetical protein